MTGKEAVRILNQIVDIHNHLMEGNDRSAFFELGLLSEELAMIIRIDECSLKPKDRIFKYKVN